MTIRELQYKIQDAIDTYGVPDDATVKVVVDRNGKVNIHGEYGCGFFELAEDINNNKD